MGFFPLLVFSFEVSFKVILIRIGYLKDFLLIISSSFLLVSSFPRFDFGMLAWVALVPLFVAIQGKGLRYGFLASLVWGMLFFMGVFYWILKVPGYTLLHHALLAVYLGAYFGLFGWAFNFISRYWSICVALFTAPFVWVSLEYIRSNLSFMALPWGLLAHSQYQYPSVIQIASLTGTYGISFLIVMMNVAIASLFLGRLKSHLPQDNPPSSPFTKGGSIGLLPFLKGGWEEFKRGKYLIIITASLLLFTLVYGYFTVTTPITGNKVNISLVQGNIEQSKKWEPRFAREIMDIFTRLTYAASKDQGALIIWPETATPGSINLDHKLHSEIKDIVIKSGTPLLFGSAQHQKFESKKPIEFKFSNSAYLFQPEQAGVKNQRYDKIHLFPFGEYLPYQEIIPWSLIGASASGNYLSGKDYTMFELSGFRFGVTICWENVFPDLVREFVRRGAQFVVNITNEARFGKTAAPYQLASISVFRAVENRIFVIRCANTGVSCIIDPYGRIVDRVKDEKGRDTFVRGVIRGQIVPLESRTIYTRYGDLLVWISFLVSTVVLIITCLRRNRKMED